MALITFVDNDDNVIGAGTKQEAWTKGIAHRIVRIFLFNSRGDLLIQKRADTLSSLPGRWDQSAAGHVDSGETYTEAAVREAAEEIGVGGLVLNEALKNYTDEKDETGKIKKRFSVSYTTVYNGEIKPNSDEVSEVRWVNPDELEQWMDKSPHEFTQGFILNLKALRQQQNLSKHALAHAKTYDALADEYEERVATHTPVTRAAVKLFTPRLPRGATVLDIGCGVGLTTQELLAEGFKVTCIDISPQMIKFAKKRNPTATCIAGDFLKINFDVPFDGLISFAFIHLFNKKDAALVLKKMHDALKPNGLAYIGTTKSEDSKEGWEVKHDYDGEHKRFRKHWTEAEFRGTLAEAGFRTVFYNTHLDPFGKIWMDFIAQKPANI